MAQPQVEGERREPRQKMNPVIRVWVEMVVHIWWWIEDLEF